MAERKCVHRVRTPRTADDRPRSVAQELAPLKINGLNGIGSAAPSRRKRGASAGGTSFRDTLKTSDAGGTAAPASTAPASRVDGLLALQEVPTSTDGRSRGVAMARDLIDGLEEIRRGLLMGAIPKSRLQNIAEMVRRRKAVTDDPDLSALLEEIDLRASVELAKLGVFI